MQDIIIFIKNGGNIKHTVLCMNFVNGRVPLKRADGEKPSSHSLYEVMPAPYNFKINIICSWKMTFRRGHKFKHSTSSRKQIKESSLKAYFFLLLIFNVYFIHIYHSSFQPNRTPMFEIFAYKNIKFLCICLLSRGFSREYNSLFVFLLILYLNTVFSLSEKESCQRTSSVTVKMFFLAG